MGSLARQRAVRLRRGMPCAMCGLRGPPIRPRWPCCLHVHGARGRDRAFVSLLLACITASPSTRFQSIWAYNLLALSWSCLCEKHRHRAHPGHPNHMPWLNLYLGLDFRMSKFHSLHTCCNMVAPSRTCGTLLAHLISFSDLAIMLIVRAQAWWACTRASPRHHHLILTLWWGPWPSVGTTHAPQAGLLDEQGVPNVGEPLPPMRAMRVEDFRRGCGDPHIHGTFSQWRPLRARLHAWALMWAGLTS